jgi:3-phosphoshikimate 1-carboxyvinyltransferase
MLPLARSRFGCGARLLQSPDPLLPLTAGRSPWLRGQIAVPGEPLQAVLALLVAALARGESVVDNVTLSPAFDAMIRALEALGVHVALVNGHWHVDGTGLLLAPEAAIDATDLGDAAPLLIGLLGAHDFDTTLAGVPAAAMNDGLLHFLYRNGAQVERLDGAVTIRGPRFGIPLDLAVATEARGLIGPLLLHAMALPGRSTLHLPPGVSDPAIGLLTQFGAPILARDGRVVLDGLAPLRPHIVAMPADPILAAVVGAVALVAADSELSVENVALTQSGAALLHALKLLGGDISFAPGRLGPGVADLTVRSAPLAGARIPAILPVAREDLILLAVVASFAPGETVLEGVREGAHRLTLTRALRANGVDCAERAEGLLIRGTRRPPGGGTVTTRLDPKLAMAFLVMGLGAEQPVTIDDGGVVARAFPGLIPALEHTGARFTGAGR